MTRDSKSKARKSGKPQQLPPLSGTQVDVIEQVMEHVSSPFRWEVLDVPLNEQKKDKRHRAKEQ